MSEYLDKPIKEQPLELTSEEPKPKAPAKKKRGRPKKSEVDQYKSGNRGKVGRPKGDAAKMNELKARFLASPKSELVLRKIFEAALDDEHKSQSAAWKLLLDRALPVGMFEKEVQASGGRNAIQINITGVGSVGVSGNSKEDPEVDDYIDGEIVD